MKELIQVVKIGGNVIDDEGELDAFLGRFAALRGPKVLAHGGGKVASRTLQRMGIEPVMVEGRRVTDAASMPVITMVYGGLVNKTLVAGLQARHCQALGLTGADFDSIRAKKRPAQPVDYGFAGDVTEVNASAFVQLLDLGVTPVLAPLTHDGAGQLLNTNADTVAASVAGALAKEKEHAVRLLVCFEKSGVLAAPQDDSSAVPVLDFAAYQTGKANGTLSGGMLPKLHNAFAALESGVSEAYIGKAEDLLTENFHCATRIALTAVSA